MPTEQRPQTIRKSLSLTIIAIGAFMLLVCVVAAIAKKDTDPFRGVIPGAASLILTGSVLYLRRAREEKKLKADSQT